MLPTEPSTRRAFNTGTNGLNLPDDVPVDEFGEPVQPLPTTHELPTGLDNPKTIKVSSAMISDHDAKLAKAGKNNVGIVSDPPEHLLNLIDDG